MAAPKNSGDAHHVPTARVLPSADGAGHSAGDFKTEHITSQQLASRQAALFSNRQCHHGGRRTQRVVVVERVRRRGIEQSRGAQRCALSASQQRCLRCAARLIN